MSEEIYDPEDQSPAVPARKRDVQAPETFAYEGETVPYRRDAQKETAKALKMTWKFEGEEYALAVANKTGNVGSPIINPATQKQVGILFADFAWEDAKPFIDHLNLNLRDERTSRDDESIRRKANMTAQNSKLFRELVQRGAIIKIDAQGEKTEPQPRTREELLNMAPEIILSLSMTG